MILKCDQIDNFDNSLENFKSMKVICDDLIKYIRTYKQLTLDFSKKLSNMQSNFSKKLTKSENPMANQIVLHTGKLIELFDENIGLYKLSIEELESRVKSFESDLKQKCDNIKIIQKKIGEQKKIILNSYLEIYKAKNYYVDSMTKTEEIINKYFSDKKVVAEYDLGLAKKININDYNALREKLKFELNDMNNSIKVSKNAESIYQDLITASYKVHDNFVENYNNYNNQIKFFSIDLSEQIKSMLLSFYLTYKNSYRQPMVSTDMNINSLNGIDEGKEIEKIYMELCKNDNPLQNVSPAKYKLKSIEFLKDNNFFNSPEVNINSYDDDLNDDERSKLGRKSISKLEDGFSQLQYISDSSLFMTIKTIFTNFTLIEKEEFNLEQEEIKFKTQQYILKIESNMNSYPYAKFGPLSLKNEDNNLAIFYKRNELSEEETNDLINLLNYHESRIIFLQKLSDYRARGKFYLDQKDYDIIVKYFNIIANKVKDNMDYHCSEMLIILSQTYFMEKGVKTSVKKYIQDDLTKNKLFQDKNFWEEFLVFMINKEIMKTQRRDKMTMENKASTENKLSNIVFSQLLTLIDNMAEFGCDIQSIKETIEPKILYYKLNDTLKKTINDVLNSKNKAEKEEKSKKENKDEKEEKDKNIKGNNNEEFKEDENKK